MKSRLSALFAPADDVVAIHESADAADAAVCFLGRAGYPGRMLAVVADESPPIASAAPSRLAHWRTSGVFWGTVWAAIALVDATLLAHHLLPFGIILMGGVCLLAIQTAFVHSSVAPERSTRASWHGSVQPGHAYASELAAGKLLLVVRGTRSEIALARTILALRLPGADVALA